MLLRRHAIVALTLLALAPGAALAQATTPEVEADPLAQIVGSYRFSQSAERGREIIHQAIDRDTDSMNIFTRGIARGRLEGKNPLVQRIQIRMDGDDVIISLDSRSYRAPKSGARVAARDNDGNAIEISHRIENGKLVQTFYSDSGTRRNVFQLRGNMLQLNVTITSGSLPGPVRYGLRYRRS
jgi:hypothetical protein